MIFLKVFAIKALHLNLCLHLGMSKLMRLLPNNQRDEVRDQALSLIKQLTANNSHMKKLLVFDEVMHMIHMKHVFPQNCHRIVDFDAYLSIGCPIIVCNYQFRRRIL